MLFPLLCPILLVSALLLHDLGVGSLLELAVYAQQPQGWHLHGRRHPRMRWRERGKAFVDRFLGRLRQVQFSVGTRQSILGLVDYRRRRCQRR